MEPPYEEPSYCLPENEVDSQKFEKIAGEKENSLWLIMNNKYILHQKNVEDQGRFLYDK